MKRRLVVALVAVVCGVLASAPGAARATSFCGDSWGADGHSGPWYVGSDQSLHGNTLVIGGADCAGTQWDVTYDVFKESPGGAVFNPIHSVQLGIGPTSFSISRAPIGCNPGWLYYTQVRNNVTGNTIRKPVSGKVIC